MWKQDEGNFATNDAACALHTPSSEGKRQNDEAFDREAGLCECDEAERQNAYHKPECKWQKTFLEKIGCTHLEKVGTLPSFSTLFRK